MSVESPGPRIVFLISHERSGSHYLTDLLTSTGKLRSLDEVCNFNAIDPDKHQASFFRFKREAQASDPDIVLRPGLESMTRLLNGYLEFLSALVSSELKILVDIKYGHVHNFELGWWPTERRPFLFNYLEQNAIPVIHLTRRDSIAATVSNLIAEKTAVWHRREAGESAAAATVRVPVQRAVHEALLLEQEKQNFFGWLTSANVFGVEYEEIAGGEAERIRAMKRLCEFLGLSQPAEFRSGHRKVTPPLEEIVENYDDLIRLARLFGGGKLRLGG